jgi:hypothetical protein
MREFLIASAATAAIVGASVISSAQAAPTATDRLNIIEAAHMWNDQSYCWYDEGWNGAGWYQCGYAGRRGYGWGGPMGWHGWGSHMMWGNHMGGWRHHHMGGW